MTILTIDASTKSTGYAIFEDTSLIYYGCITASSNDLIKRIQKIIEGLHPILQEYDVDKIILEEVRPDTESGEKRNIKTYRALMWLQAAIAFLAHEISPRSTIEYVYPSSWRAACGIKTGRGVKRASLKPADMKFVKDNYNIEVNDDIADAIGIGHAYTNVLDNEINWE